MNPCRCLRPPPPISTFRPFVHRYGGTSSATHSTTTHTTRPHAQTYADPPPYSFFPLFWRQSSYSTLFGTICQHKELHSERERAKLEWLLSPFHRAEEGKEKTPLAIEKKKKKRSGGVPSPTSRAALIILADADTSESSGAYRKMSCAEWGIRDWVDGIRRFWNKKAPCNERDKSQIPPLR